MKKFKTKLSLVTFLTSFFLRFGIILLLGVVFCFMGVNNNKLLLLGMIFIGIDFVLSLCNVFLTQKVIKDSEHPAMKDLYDAIENDRMDEYVDKLENGDLPYVEHLSSQDDSSEGDSVFTNLTVTDRAENFRKTLEKDIEKGDSVVACVNVFEYALKNYLNGEALNMKSEITADKDFSFQLTYLVGLDISKAYKITLELLYDGSEATPDMCESIHITKLDGEFFSLVRESEAYKYAMGKDAKDFKITSKV